MENKLRNNIRQVLGMDISSTKKVEMVDILVNDPIEETMELKDNKRLVESYESKFIEPYSKIDESDNEKELKELSGKNKKFKSWSNADERKLKELYSYEVMKKGKLLKGKDRDKFYRDMAKSFGRTANAVRIKLSDIMPLKKRKWLLKK